MCEVQAALDNNVSGYALPVMRGLLTSDDDLAGDCVERMEELDLSATINRKSVNQRSISWYSMMANEPLRYSLN